ncbi:MAG: ribosome biogenesis factor YjgA [Methylovulum sp.]|uniref:ribosome biogenesis factor YjgA n=1 Tax=Methylovulum sp. TaxID=1916980 RepID=UPI00262FEB8A|nr:ribosome biogenesis factor YjgA [Methylovulum sp.]MDD2724732.1 ribosome biogenesis factor YjgA [Methylovulum sp.]MDD5124743.1 ribosome biogenesis factor YjgA [Methylovulum sp.]
MNEEYDYEYEYDDNGEIVYYAVRPNKTQIKKEIAGLFELGEKMSELSPAQLSTLELPANIHKAVTEVSGMPHKGARKRLLKYIAGQLHKIDVDEFTEKLARIENKSAHAVREHHIVERWRERLLAESNEALSELLDEYPQADRQHLRQLVRNAQKEVEMAKPPKSSRLLYRYLKTLFNFTGGVEEEDFADDGREAEEDL